MNLGFNWKGIDFSALLQGQAGIKDVYLSALYKSTVRQGYQLNADIIEDVGTKAVQMRNIPVCWTIVIRVMSNILIFGWQAKLI